MTKDNRHRCNRAVQIITVLSATFIHLNSIQVLVGQCVSGVCKRKKTIRVRTLNLGISCLLAHHFEQQVIAISLGDVPSLIC